MNENTLKRHSAALEKIGYLRLLELPEEIKKLLEETRDLEVKTVMLEAIAEALEKQNKV